MYDGQARYSPMCNENGGVVDDLIVYKVKDEDYFIVVNAANKDKDYEWMKAHVSGEAELSIFRDQVAQIALQGPKSEEILKKLVPEEQIPEKYYSAVFGGKIQGMDCIISRNRVYGRGWIRVLLSCQGRRSALGSPSSDRQGRRIGSLRAGRQGYPETGSCHAAVRS